MLKGTILIVEDKNEFRKIYGDRLRYDGYEVLDAPDGEAGLAVLNSRKVDLVVTDINMPKKDGFEVIKEMQQDEKLKRIPIFVMSVFDGGDYVTKSLSLGAVDYLVKGTHTPNQVSEKISKYLAQKSS